LGTEIMPNGQYHGTKKGHGIRIKNPLRLTVEVTILDGNAKKRISPSFSTCRTIKPGAEVWVKVPQPGQYDIKTSIIRYDEVGEVIRLGDGDWQHAPQPPGQPIPKQPQPGPIFITESITVDSQRWRTVAEWLVLKGFMGELRAVNIELTGDCEARVILPSHPTKTVIADTTLTWQTPVLLHKGEAVRVKARSRLGNQGRATIIIQGELHAIPVPTGVGPEHSVSAQVTEEKPTEEPEETELRSLGDLIEDMRKEEEVKV